LTVLPVAYGEADVQPSLLPVYDTIPPVNCQGIFSNKSMLFELKVESYGMPFGHVLLIVREADTLTFHFQLSTKIILPRMIF
jgi:hypothetical protein